jgi:hypothetical protein
MPILEKRRNLKGNIHSHLLNILESCIVNRVLEINVSNYTVLCLDHCVGSCVKAGDGSTFRACENSWH